MKKNRILPIVIVALLSFSNATYCQSLKDILNSSAVKEAVTSVTGGKKLTVENLSGSWTYTNPAIQLEGDNALKNVAGSVASAEMEKKLKEYCAKAGIVEGAFKYTFNNDSTFTNVLKGRTLKGTYSFNADEKTIELHYGKSGKFKMTTLTAHVVLSNNELSLLFNADKLLDFITKASAVSQNTTLQAINKLASQYEGMLMGFELKK